MQAKAILLIRQTPKQGRALLIFIKALKSLPPADRRAVVDWLSALVDDMNRQVPTAVPAETHGGLGAV